MNGIFISYRRDDSAGYAGRLYDRLAAAFGAERVFMDVEGIELGTDFVVAIERALDASAVFIALIGREWSQAKDAAGRRRLDDAQDFIRLETAMAFARKLRVVPVLVDDAVMPRADELPPELAELARRQAIEINHRQWEASTGALIQALTRILDAPANDAVDASDTTGKHKPKFAAYAAGLVAIAVAVGTAYFLKSHNAPVTVAPHVPATSKDTTVMLAEEKRAASEAGRIEVPSVSSTPASPPATPTHAAPSARAVAKAKPVTKPRAADEVFNEVFNEVSKTAAAPKGDDALRSNVADTAARSSVLPATGDRWTYRLHSKWPSNKDQTFQFVVNAVEGEDVALGLLRLDNDAQRPTRMRVRGKEPELVDWVGFGMEFSPFIAAFGAVAEGSAWRVSAPEPSGFIGRWSCRGGMAGHERISVPAGNFDAVKVALDCNRSSSGSVAEKSVEPVWMHFDAWYAGEAKRYVRLVRRVVTVDRTEADKDVIDLIDYRRANR